MGTFKKNGQWYIDYYVHGRRKREKIGPSKKLAETVLGKRKAQIAEGKYLDKKKIKRIKFSDFVEVFLETYSKPNKASWKDDKIRLTLAVSFFGKATYLDDITPFQIEQFKKHKLQEGTKDSTINRYLTILKTVYNKAIEWGNAKENPFNKVKHYKENNARVRYLEKEEIGRLLDACPQYVRQIVMVAINTGMRKNEIFSLKWSDIDFRNDLIYIHKTKNNERKIIPMNLPLKRTLINMREHSKEDELFPVKRIEKPFSKALKCATITNCRFHDLRHTFASHLVMNGVDLMTVKELLGHKDIKMTMRYSHLSRGHKNKAVDKIGSMMDTIWTPENDKQAVEKCLDVVTVINKDTYIKVCQ